MTGKLTGKMTYPHYFETDLMTGTETFLGMGKEQIFSLNELQNFVKTFCDDSPEIEPTAAAHPYLIKKAIQPHQLDATTAS